MVAMGCIRRGGATMLHGGSGVGQRKSYRCRPYPSASIYTSRHHYFLQSSTSPSHFIISHSSFSSSSSSSSSRSSSKGGKDNNVITISDRKVPATLEETYSRKTPLEHILLRPSMYIGPTERLPPVSSWVLQQDCGSDVPTNSSNSTATTTKTSNSNSIL